MATHFSKLIIKEVRKETADCVSVAFDIPPALEETFRFIHGQNLTIKTFINGEEIRRSYSICSSPLEKELRIAVKKVTGGKFSGYANEQLLKGASLDVLPATGKFYTTLHPENNKQYIAFAAGSGITPIISIIKTTLATEPASSFVLVYGNRNRNSIIFKEELEALKNKYIGRFVIHHILSRERMDASINYGHINPEKCDDLGKKLVDIKAADEIFLCGPADMIFGLKEWLEQQSIDPTKIHFELFASPRQQVAVQAPVDQEESAKGPISKVTIKQDGTSFDFDLPFDGLSILDAALQQGADLPFACKGGVCSTCRAWLTEGKVEMDINYALEPEEIKAGFILTCQSHPRTEKLVIDFDVK